MAGVVCEKQGEKISVFPPFLGTQLSGREPERWTNAWSSPVATRGSRTQGKKGEKGLRVRVVCKPGAENGRLGREISWLGSNGGEDYDVRAAFVVYLRRSTSSRGIDDPNVRVGGARRGWYNIHLMYCSADHVWGEFRLQFLLLVALSVCIERFPLIHLATWLWCLWAARGRTNMLRPFLIPQLIILVVWELHYWRIMSCWMISVDS